MDITLMAGLRLARMPCSGIIVWMCIVALALNLSYDFGLCRTLYGGEGNEAIRFMDTDHGAQRGGMDCRGGT